MSKKTLKTFQTETEITGITYLEFIFNWDLVVFFRFIYNIFAKCAIKLLLFNIFLLLSWLCSFLSLQEPVERKQKRDQNSNLYSDVGLINFDQDAHAAAMTLLLNCTSTSSLYFCFFGRYWILIIVQT